MGPGRVEGSGKRSVGVWEEVEAPWCILEAWEGAVVSSIWTFFSSSTVSIFGFCICAGSVTADMVVENELVCMAECCLVVRKQ